MQAQQTLTFPGRTFSTVIAAAATLIAAALAVALIATTDRSVTSSAPAVIPLRSVGAELVAHDRSEQGLGAYRSVGGDQIAHDRSEQGFTSN